MPEEVLQKTCRICKTARPIDQFYKSPVNKGGHVNTCIPCYPSLHPKVEVQCAECCRVYQKMKHDLVKWNRLCRKCSTRLVANRPEIKKATIKRFREIIEGYGGAIPGGHRFQKGHTSQRKTRPTKEKNPNWKGGKPFCADCGKQLSHASTVRCQPCYIKAIRVNPTKKRAHLKHIPRGQNHHCWKGGKEKWTRRINNAAHRHFRKSVLIRDGYKCVLCDAINVPLQVDHIQPLLTHPELEYDPDNGRTLCVPCHRKTDTYGLKEYYRQRKTTADPGP
jgi:5-methylcytosine-specific restriction endonuclease McrA